MTAQIAAYGRLVADVQTKTTSNNKQMSFIRLAVRHPQTTKVDVLHQRKAALIITKSAYNKKYENP